MDEVLIPYAKRNDDGRLVTIDEVESGWGDPAGPGEWICGPGAGTAGWVGIDDADRIRWRDRAV